MNSFLGKDHKINLFGVSQRSPDLQTTGWLARRLRSWEVNNVLPTCGDVLKEVLFKRNVPENKTVDLMSLVSVGEVTTRVLLGW